MNTATFNNEIALLAKRSNGTRDDAISEWSYNQDDYRTLCNYVARGFTTMEKILAAVTNDRQRRVLAAGV